MRLEGNLSVLTKPSFIVPNGPAPLLVSHQRAVHKKKVS